MPASNRSWRPSSAGALPPKATGSPLAVVNGTWSCSAWAATAWASSRPCAEPDAACWAWTSIRSRCFDAVFGDATDSEFLAHLPLSGVAWAVSAVPEHHAATLQDDPRRSLVLGLREQAFRGRIAVAVHEEASAAGLRRAGADLVLMPYRDASAEAAALVIRDGTDTPAATADPQGQRELVV